MLFLVAVFCLLLEIRGQGGVVTPIPGVIGNQTSPNLIATCNPGSAGGMNTGALEIIILNNCSVYTQPLDAFNKHSNISGTSFQQLLSSGSYPKSMGFWMPNPSGVRYTTMSGQCNWASPGGFSKVNQSMGIGSIANNSGNWFQLASMCPANWKGGCYLGTCPPTGNAKPGDIKVYPNLKCSNLQWKYPLPTGTNEIATLTDPVGNKYIQHAYASPNYTLPVAAVPPGWTLGVASFKQGDPPLTITPVNPLNGCGDMSNLAEAGCLYMMAQDGYGNAYHRYFWSGREPPLYTLSLSPVPMYPGRTGDQAAQCQALSEYTLYSIPTTKAKASRGSVNFAIDLSAPAFSVQSEVGGLKSALTTTTNKAVSLLDMATSAKGQGAAVVSGTVSGKQSVAYINITKVSVSGSKLIVSFTPWMHPVGYPAKLFGGYATLDLTITSTVNKPSLYWFATSDP